MEKFAFHVQSIVSEETLADIKWLRETIMQEYDIKISMQDAYLLWTCISDDFYDHMLVVPTGLTTKEYIREKMSEYGCIIKMS